MTVHAAHCLKLALLAGGTFITVACGGVLAASRWRDHRELVAGIATFTGALLLGFAWLWWPRPRLRLPRRRVAGSRTSPETRSETPSRRHPHALNARSQRLH